MIGPKYRELLATCAFNAAITGERAVEVEKKNDPEKDQTESMKMIEQFREINRKLLDNQELTFEEYGKLWIGTSFAVKTLQKNIDTWTAVVNSYRNDILPHLYEIATEEDRDKAGQLVEKYFKE